MSDPRNKQIKIQTGVVKRITKEKLMYEKEVKLTEDRIQRMKDEGKILFLIMSKVEISILLDISSDYEQSGKFHFAQYYS